MARPQALALDPGLTVISSHRALAEDNGVVSERAVAAGQGYAKYRESLRRSPKASPPNIDLSPFTLSSVVYFLSELAKTTFGFPRVVGVEWRIDYVVKSRHLEKNYQPGYIVTLHTVDKQGEPKDVTFACSVEELTDLVDNLRDATKQVARIVKTAA